jgi:hypothetical protein
MSFLVSIIVSSAVDRPGTISTRGSKGAGLKKCVPITRSGFSQADAIAVIEREDVLVAKIVSAENDFSSFLNASCFASSFSIIASMISPQSSVTPTKSE